MRRSYGSFTPELIDAPADRLRPIPADAQAILKWELHATMRRAACRQRQHRETGPLTRRSQSERRHTADCHQGPYSRPLADLPEQADD